jgi:hypothetical protein
MIYVRFVKSQSCRDAGTVIACVKFEAKAWEKFSSLADSKRCGWADREEQCVSYFGYFKRPRFFSTDCDKVVIGESETEQVGVDYEVTMNLMQGYLEYEKDDLAKYCMPLDDDDIFREHDKYLERTEGYRHKYFVESNFFHR